MKLREEKIRATSWAGALTEDELTRASTGISERQLQRGSYLCHRGDRLDYYTGVYDGLIKIATISQSGKAITFAGIGSGGWFGEGSVLKDEPRKYDLVALRDTVMLMMNKTTFFWLYENSVGFNRYLVRQLNERMGQFIATIEYDRILDSRERVARYISWLFNPVLYPGTGSAIAITQEELGLLAGVSRQTVNQILKTLESEGLVTYDKGMLHANDIDALKGYESAK